VTTPEERYMSRLKRRRLFTRKTLPIVVCVFLAAASRASAETTGRTVSGNPDGYAVFILSADSLAAKSVTINGRAVDTSSVAAVRSSVEAIVGSTDALCSVEETRGGASELFVDFTSPGTSLSKLFYGMNLEWRGKYFLGNPIFRELVRNIHVDIMRFPGGQDRIRFDRLAKTTPHDALGMDQPYQFILTGEDVARFIGFCRELDIEAEPEMNLYVDDPARAESMIEQIVNELGYRLRYISAGNEPDIDTFSSWSLFGAKDEAGVFAAYATRLERYAARINRIQSGITYVLPELGTWAEPKLARYLDTIFSRLKAPIKTVVSGHWYMLGDWGQAHSAPDFPSRQHLVVRDNARHEIAYLAHIRDVMAAAAARRFPGAELFIGEWGTSWSPDTARTGVLDSLSTAIFIAEVQEFCKVLGFSSLQWYTLADPIETDPWNPALIAVGKGTFVLRPQYYVYLIYKYLWGDTIVSVPGGQGDDFSLYASKGKDYHYLMLINRTEGETILKTVRVTTENGERLLRLTSHPHSVGIVRF
jgi:hypothetical protein